LFSNFVVNINYTANVVFPLKNNYLPFLNIW